MKLINNTVKVLQVVFQTDFSRGGSSIDVCGGERGFSKLSEKLREDISSLTYKNFEVVETRYVKDFSMFRKMDGFLYDVQSYEKVYFLEAEHHKPDFIDYRNLIKRLDIKKEIEENLYDEVWVWGVPWLGLYESRMVGCKTHWLNSPGLEIDSSRRFVIMGLSYERDVACALESFAHRIESVFFIKYSILWEFFKRQVGIVHIPPNGINDYDFDNSTKVKSMCDSWNNNTKIIFPKIKNVNCENWRVDGNCHYGYMQWWINHIPRSVLDSTFNVN